MGECKVSGRSAADASTFQTFSITRFLRPRPFLKGQPYDVAIWREAEIGLRQTWTKQGGAGAEPLLPRQRTGLNRCGFCRDSELLRSPPPGASPSDRS